MTLPPANSAAFMLLGALAAVADKVPGFSIETEAGELFVVVPSGRGEAVSTACLDALEEHGLIDLGGVVPAPTERGMYYLRKWLWKHHTKERGR